MKAVENNLFKFLREPKQFIIPIFQRTYSWGKRECEQIWRDIIRVGRDDNLPGHFIGSVVKSKNDNQPFTKHHPTTVKK